MTTNNQTKTDGNVTTENPTTGTETAGISAGANPSIPQHILDFCHRIYPPTLGTAYDAQRAHLIAKRMQIERELVGRDVPGAPLSVAKPSDSPIAPERTVAPIPQIPPTAKSCNEPATNPPQSNNQPAINTPQIRNESTTNPQQNPLQNEELVPNEPSPAPRKFKRRGPDSIIDSLPAETQEAISNLLEQYSADRVVIILSRPGPHGPALDIDRFVLYRYQRRLRREQALTRAAETKTFVTKLLDDPHAPEDQLSAAIRHIFQTRLLEEVNDPTHSLSDMLKSLQTCELFRKTELAARRIAAKQKN